MCFVGLLFSRQTSWLQPMVLPAVMPLRGLALPDFTNVGLFYVVINPLNSRTITLVLFLRKRQLCIAKKMFMDIKTLRKNILIAASSS